MTIAIEQTELRKLAEAIMTEREFQAWDLCRTHNWTIRRTAAQLGIAPSSVKDRLANGERKLARHSRSEFPAAPTTPVTVVPDLNIANLAVALLIERDGPICYLCRREFPPSALVIEHIIPRIHGGTNKPTNIALACGTCNSEKSTRYVSLLVASGRAVYHSR